MHADPTPLSEGHRERAALPAAALIHLHRALRKEVGPLEAVHALHDAGFATGDLLFRELQDRMGPNIPELHESRFWKELDAFFDAKGWGGLTHERVHPGLGMLRARDWGESDPESPGTQPSCAFSAGLLAHILGRIAGGALAVLEVACRSRGDGECHFLFGSEPAIHEVYGLLLDEGSLDAALGRL